MRCGWIGFVVVAMALLGCSDDADGGGSQSGSASGSSGGGEESEGSGTGSPELCGGPGHSTTLVVDGEAVPLPAFEGEVETMTADATSISAANVVPVEGFEIGEETQVLLSFGGLTIGPGDPGMQVGLQYLEFPPADEPRPADVMISEPAVGTLTVHSIPAATGERLCGDFDLTVSAERQIELSGHFNHVLNDEPLPG